MFAGAGSRAGDESVATQHPIFLFFIFLTPQLLRFLFFFYSFNGRTLRNGSKQEAELWGTKKRSNVELTLLVKY